jgi:hypothetical protein
MVNCTVANNVAQAGTGEVGLAATGSALGGGIYTEGRSASLVNVTVAGNELAFTNICLETCPMALGSSVCVTNQGLFTLTNTILSGSFGATNVFGSIIDGGHNICSDASANFTSPTSRNDTDPLLGALGYYGGPTPTMPLLPNSPAIDAGDNAACPATDQRGVSRPQGVACDIGAFELYPTVTLAPAAQGKVSVLYHFKAFQTNAVSNSSTLMNWVGIGTRVSDAQGTAELEQVAPAQVSNRFYKLVPK